MLNCARIHIFRSLLTLLLLAYPSVSFSATDDLPGSLGLSGAVFLGDFPTFVADKEGFLERYGLDIEVIYRDSGWDSLRALKAGDTDFALMALTPLLLDRLSTNRPSTPSELVILASLVSSTRLNHVVAKSSGKITQPSDLEGRRVGLVRGTNSEYLWWLFSTYHRLDSSRIEVLDLPVARQTEALLADEVDAVVTWEPWISRLADQAGGAIEVFGGSELYAENWVLVSTRKTVNQDDNTIRRLLQSYQEAIDFIQAHPDRALAAYAQFVNRDPGTALRESYLPDFALSLDWSLLFELQLMLQWAHETRGMDNSRPLDILSWIESEPLRQLLPLNVGIPQPGPVEGATEP